MESAPLHLAHWELIFQRPPPVLVQNRVYNGTVVHRGWHLGLLPHLAIPTAHQTQAPSQIAWDASPGRYMVLLLRTHLLLHTPFFPGTSHFLVTHPKGSLSPEILGRGICLVCPCVQSVGKGGLAVELPHPPGPRASWWSRMGVVPGGS